MRKLSEMPQKPSRLFLGIALVTMLAGCGGESPTQTPPSEAAAANPAPVEDTSWFTRGGDMHRASTLDDWRAATTVERLESAADLLSMRMAPNLPDFDQAVQMARTLEAEISEEAESDAQGALGPIVDNVFTEMNW